MNNKLSLLVNFVGVDKMSGALRNIVGLGKKGSTSLRALSGEAKKLQNEIKRYDRLIEQTTGNTTALWNSQKIKLQELEAVQARIARQQRLMAIDADRQAMANRAEALKGKGQENMLGGAAMAAPFILATTKAAEFSSGMVDIQQKANLNNIAADKLAQKIIALSRAAKQMPEDMRAGLDSLLAKGMNVDVATKAMGPIGKLATAYKVEIPDAANSTFAALANLKIAAGDTGKVLDAMAAAGNDGGFEVRDMARYFPSLTAQMQALGERGVPAVADLSAALQVAMHTAGNADEAGNNVTNLLAKINSPSTIAAFKKNFGVDLPAAMKKLTDEGHSSLEAITMITQKATGGDSKKLGFAFEDQQARMGMLALIQNFQEYQKIRAHAMKAGGTVDAAFSQRVVRDTTVQWRDFMGSVSTVAIVLGSTLLPVANQLLGQISAMATGVAAWAQAHPALAAALLKGAATLITFRIGLGAAQFALGSILGPFARVYAFFRKVDGISKFGAVMARLDPILSSTASFMVRGFGLMRTAAMFLAQGLLRAGALMLANPIILVITAIVVAVGAAAYLIYTHWDKIYAAFRNGVAWVKQTIGGLPGWLKNIGAMMMVGLLAAINPMALAWKLIEVAKIGIRSFKDYLGIKSPSRVFMALGGHVATGLEQGIDGNRHGPARAVGRMAAGVMAAGAMSLSPIQSAARPVAGAAQHGGRTIEIHIHQQPGEDVDTLTRRIMAAIKREDARAARSSMEDR